MCKIHQHKATINKKSDVDELSSIYTYLLSKLIIEHFETIIRRWLFSFLYNCQNKSDAFHIYKILKLKYFLTLRSAYVQFTLQKVYQLYSVPF